MSDELDNDFEDEFDDDVEDEEIEDEKEVVEENKLNSQSK